LITPRWLTRKSDEFKFQISVEKPFCEARILTVINQAF
jgi:hypothetical protein